MKIAVLTAALFAAAGLGAHAFAEASARTQDPPRPRPFPGAAPPSTQTPPQQQPPATQDPALGLPMYPGAQLLTTYEAGPNQKVHLYGTSAAYPTVVEFFKTALKERGRTLFGGPMHQFDLGRFRRETMTLQPALTVKDYTWNGREGYVHVSGRQVIKYPTVIQVVPLGAER